jgi:hypothetical protein
MAVDVTLWVDSFSEKSFPLWPCPTCARGHMVSGEKSVRTVEPNYSKDARAHEAWEPEWITERFLAILKCDNKKCGELSIVAGETELVEEEDDEDGRVYVTHLIPRSIFPPTPIIDIPEETPRDVKKDIVLAFQLYWSDLGASANRLRTSIERILDHFEIPKTITSNKKKRFRPLASRIDLFTEKNPAFKDSLNALRQVGNLGTHSTIDRQSLLAAFSILEDALAELFGKRSKKAKSLIKKLIKGKGKLKA